jgi:hypothetical protein
MKKDPDTEKGRNVTAVRHDEKSALRLDAILRKSLYYPSHVLRGPFLP